MMAGEEDILSSSEADAERMLGRASKAGLFDGLRRIYAGLPRTSCDNCARCCFESPGVFYVEYLSLLDTLAKMPGARRDELIRRAFRELFFSWIEPDRTCIFLESQRCTIYDQRPLACRLFGLVPAADRDAAEAQARLAAREEARRLSRFGIEVPEAVIRRALVSCDKVRNARGEAVTVNAEAIAARVAKLDTALISQQLVIEEFCFRSLPERLGAAAVGDDAVSALRLQLLRRAQAGELVTDLLELILAQARPVSPTGKRGS